MEGEEDIETDGVNSKDIDKSQTHDQIQRKEQESNQKLQAGFGFTSATSQFRIYGVNDKGACAESAIETTEQKKTDQNGMRKGENILTCNRIENKVFAFSCKNFSSNTDDAKDLAVQTSEIEIDTIILNNVQEKVLSTPPTTVSEDFVDMSPNKLPTEPTTTWFCMIPIGRKKPEKKSHILIPHNRADKPEGDDFGAYLCTFKDKLKDGSIYYRHFLVDIDDAGPADQMKIDNNDEMVLLNENFVPELTHNEVLALFRDVKVDGISRFTLVLRRVRAQKWEWIETSAILAPDKHTDDHPVVERVEFKELRGERIEVPKSKHLYKVPGTQQYLDICDGKVSIDTLKHDDSDRTKIITKRAKYWQDDGDQIHINFAAALCDEEMKWYIGIDRDKVVLKREPVWFKMIKVGSKIRFQFNKRYLGYDLENDEVKPEVSQCVFAELPASAMNIEDPPSHSEDYIPENTERMSEAPSEKSHHSSIASSLSSIHLDNRSVASSQTSVDSDNSSILSSQVSTDSGGAFAEFHRSFSGTDSCGEQSSLSQASTTSDYRSDNYTEEDMTVCKPTDMLLSEPEKSKKDLMTAPSPQVDT